jgi:hypothetical protein
LNFNKQNDNKLQKITHQDPRDSMQEILTTNIHPQIAKETPSREITSHYFSKQQVFHPFAQEKRDSEMSKEAEISVQEKIIK